MNILVVDDCPNMVQALCSIFEKLPTVQRITGTQTFVDAVNEFGRHHYHVVLIDVDLKDKKNGIDLCRWIRKRNNKCIIIFITGFSTNEVMQQAYEAGTNDYIRKPILRSEVRLKVLYWWEFIKCGKSKRGFLQYHGLKFIFKSNELLADGKKVPLTKSLKRLMVMFLEKPETVISHDKIQQELWGDHDTAIKQRNLHERIGALREALPEWYREWIQSVRGEGYKLMKEKYML